MKQICEIYYRSGIVWEPPMGKFSDGPLVELIGTFAVKGTNGVETDEMKEGEFMSSSTAAMHGLLTTFDEVLAVSDLSKMTISKNKEEREETRSSIADNLTTGSENKEEREETRSSIAANFILTDQLPGHHDKDFLTIVKSFLNDPEIQRRLHEYLDKCYEMNIIYKEAIKAVLSKHKLHVDGKCIRFYYCIL
jgi:hypothetical protein